MYDFVQEVTLRLAAGRLPADIASDLGLAPSSFSKKCAERGIRLRGIAPQRTSVPSYRAVAETMKPADGLEYALQVIDMLLGSDQNDRWRVRQEGFGPSEVRVLLKLISCEGRPVSRTTLLAVAAADPNDDLPGIKVVDVHIYKIRAKLAARFPGARIKTFWGEGYGFERDEGFLFPWENQQ